uniref:Uncharacterized protein n=1 Tax=Laticauda laticaudata TaxID=8630 RepID=A0A8C5SM72_LATLA
MAVQGTARKAHTLSGLIVIQQPLDLQSNRSAIDRSFKLPPNDCQPVGHEKILVGHREISPSEHAPKAINPVCAETQGSAAHMAHGNPPCPLTPYPANLPTKLLFFLFLTIRCGRFRLARKQEMVLFSPQKATGFS